MRSWAYDDVSSPYNAFIKVNGKRVDNEVRGHRIVVIDAISGDIENVISFDTWGDIYAAIRIKIFLKTLKPNKWIIITVHDSGWCVHTQVRFFFVFCFYF